MKIHYKLLEKRYKLSGTKHMYFFNSLSTSQIRYPLVNETYQTDPKPIGIHQLIQFNVNCSISVTKLNNQKLSKLKNKSIGLGWFLVPIVKTGPIQTGPISYMHILFIVEIILLSYIFIFFDKK